MGSAGRRHHPARTARAGTITTARAPSSSFRFRTTSPPRRHLPPASSLPRRLGTLYAPVVADADPGRDGRGLAGLPVEAWRPDACGPSLTSGASGPVESPPQPAPCGNKPQTHAVDETRVGDDGPQ